MASVANLLWLKVRLSLGYYRRSPWRILALVITGGGALFISFSAYFFLLVLFRSLEPETSRTILDLLFFFLYVSWVLLPLLGLRLNESFDLSKLLTYPISARQMFLGSILGNFLDLSVVVLLPALLAVPAGFAHTPIEGLVISAIVLAFLLHSLTLTQTIMLLLWGVMRSRRVKDLALMFGSVLGIAIYAGQQMLFHHTGPINPFVVLNMGRSAALRWLPSGVAADGVIAAAQGRFPTALAYGLVLAALSAGSVYIAGALVARIYVGEMEYTASKGQQRANGRGRPRTSAVERRLGALRFPPEVVAVAHKEILYYARDPRLKMQLFQTTAFLVLIPWLSMMRGGFGSMNLLETPTPFIFTGVMFFLICLTLCSNQFAADGAGLNLLFLFSCSRRRLLQGKNLVLFAMLSVISLGLTLFLSVITHQVLYGVLMFLTMEAGLGIMLGLGNLLSIYLPYRLRGRGENPLAGAPGQGCVTLLLRPLLHLVVMIAAAPVIAAAVLPSVLDHPQWYLVVMPLALLYGVGVYAGLLGLAERALLRREPEILKAIVREPA